jgi:hypothetical protein
MVSPLNILKIAAVFPHVAIAGHVILRETGLSHPAFKMTVFMDQ